MSVVTDHSLIKSVSAEIFPYQIIRNYKKNFLPSIIFCKEMAPVSVCSFGTIPYSRNSCLFGHFLLICSRFEG